MGFVENPGLYVLASGGTGAQQHETMYYYGGGVPVSQAWMGWAGLSSQRRELFNGQVILSRI